jgi:hypothetical protein
MSLNSSSKCCVFVALIALYPGTDLIRGGTAAAIRFTQETGQLVGGCVPIEDPEGPDAASWIGKQFVDIRRIPIANKYW